MLTLVAVALVFVAFAGSFANWYGRRVSVALLAEERRADERLRRALRERDLAWDKLAALEARVCGLPLKVSRSGSVVAGAGPVDRFELARFARGVG